MANIGFTAFTVSILVQSGIKRKHYKYFLAALQLVQFKSVELYKLFYGNKCWGCYYNTDKTRPLQYGKGFAT